MTNRLNDFDANGVSFTDAPRADVDAIVGKIPDAGTLHLAILRQPYLDLIAEGVKTIESRFNTKRAAPFGKVAVGDLVLLKEPGQPVSNYFFAASVMLLDLTVEPLSVVREQYGDAICAQNPADFWHRKASARYCTLVGVGEKGSLPELGVTKKDQRGWVTFTRNTNEKPLTLF
jgi:hypothetical protein